jgi:hypothetical protein
MKTDTAPAQPHIIKTSTPRTAMHNGTAQAVVTATWSNSTQTTEATANLAYFLDRCIRNA